MKSLAILFLLRQAAWVSPAALPQEPAGAQVAKPPALPTITPFTIPADILQSIISSSKAPKLTSFSIPAVEPAQPKYPAAPPPAAPRPIAMDAKAGSFQAIAMPAAARGLGGFAGDSIMMEESYALASYQRPDEIAPAGSEFAGMPLQAGLPYDMGRPGISANLSSITGAGSSTIYECYNEHLSWRTATQEWVSSSISGDITFPTTTVPTTTIVTQYTNSSVPTITRCDGVVVTPSVSQTPVSLTFSEPWVSTIRTFQTPTPTCSFKDLQCDQAWSAYKTATYSYISSIYSEHFAEKKTGLPGRINFYRQEPPCPTPFETCPPKSEVDSCSLRGQRPTVFYWPTQVAGDFCGDKVTAEATPTVQGQPNTAVFESVTFTSPSPLFIIPSVTRSVMPPESLVDNYWEVQYTPCGYVKNLKFQVNPQNISSLRTIMVESTTRRVSATWSTYYSASMSAYPFDFADLNEGSVPWDAFAGVAFCSAREPGVCKRSSTIGPSEYHPQLTIGEEIQTADPDYAGCSMPDVNGQVVYYPVTAAQMDLPSVTRWGAEVTVSPMTSSLEPAGTARIPTITPFLYEPRYDMGGPDFIDSEPIPPPAAQPMPMPEPMNMAGGGVSGNVGNGGAAIADPMSDNLAPDTPVGVSSEPMPPAIPVDAKDAEENSVAPSITLPDEAIVDLPAIAPAIRVVVNA